LAALSLSACEALAPFEEVCQRRLDPGKVSVSVAPMTYKTDYSRSAQELTAKGAAAIGRVTLGYIETRLRSSLAFAGTGIVHPLTRRYCVRPDLQVALEFAPTVLYVAREQPQGSCEFAITLEHEMQHFREYQLFLAELGEKVEKELQAQFAGRIFYFESAREGEKRLQRMAQDRIEGYLQDGMAEARGRQAKHDTPEEYFQLERFQAACGNP
jgi:hypothetical protein